jgi:hypothetical protein
MFLSYNIYVSLVFIDYLITLSLQLFTAKLCFDGDFCIN